VANEIPAETRRVVNHRDEMRCQVCGAIGSELQHRMRRREGGHRKSNLIRVCSIDHRAIHANPAWALERGYTVSAVMDADPSQIPVHSYRGWVLYDDAGGYDVIAPRSMPPGDLSAFRLSQAPVEG
jgi:hypothetical protein